MIVGLYDKRTIMSFAAVLCLIPENVTGACKKNNGKWTGSWFPVIYRKIYGYFLQCRHIDDGSIFLALQFIHWLHLSGYFGYLLLISIVMVT